MVNRSSCHERQLPTLGGYMFLLKLLGVSLVSAIVAGLVNDATGMNEVLKNAPLIPGVVNVITHGLWGAVLGFMVARAIRK